MNNQQYHQQVALLIRIMPSIYRIKEFAVHGGTAINLFHQDMPRYSVDIDLTYIPIAPRSESLADINRLLQGLKEHIESAPFLASKSCTEPMCGSYSALIKVP